MLTTRHSARIKNSLVRSLQSEKDFHFFIGHPLHFPVPSRPLLLITPCRRAAASTKPHLLRFCMVQCSQSPVRQRRGRVPCTRAAAQAAALKLYHISKLPLRVPRVFTKKQGIYAAKLMLRLRLAFANRTYYTMTPRSGPNKTARAAILHGSMFSKPCALAQGRVPCTRAAAQAATLRLLYHDAVSAAIIKSEFA